MLLFSVFYNIVSIHKFHLIFLKKYVTMSIV